MTENTLLYRQVHPTQIVDNRLSSVAFRPKDSDGGKLSVYNGDLITASGSHSHYTRTTSYQSQCVFGVTVAECTSEELTCIDDGMPFAEHASIDYGDLRNGPLERKAKKVRGHALNRGQLHPETEAA